MPTIQKIFTILFNILLSLLPVVEAWNVNMVENISNPQQVLWVNKDKAILVKNENIFEYIPSKRVLTKLKERRGNEFVGIARDGSTLLCRIEHFTISSPKESSTRFTINGKEYSFFETIRPIHLSENEIVAVTSFDFLEQHYYKINIEDGAITEIQKPKGNKYELKIGRGLLFKKAYVFNTERYIVEDIFGNLHMYRKEGWEYLLRKLFSL